MIFEFEIQIEKYLNKSKMNPFFHTNCKSIGTCMTFHLIFIKYLPENSKNSACGLN